VRALVFDGLRQVRHASVPDPGLRAPTDAIVRVERAAICGSDLHAYRGNETGLDPGTVMGHELAGEVVEAGAGVRRFPPGARVVSPFSTSCGECWYCRTGLTARCTAGQLFGWVAGGAGLQGAQAEYVRVPLADSTLVTAPPDLPLEIALLAGDVLATGFHGAELAAAAPGRVVAVVGCGAVGLMAVVGARALGAERVFALDPVRERLELAERLGAEPLALGEEAGSAARVGGSGGAGDRGTGGGCGNSRERGDGRNPRDRGDEARHAVLAATGGRGADGVIEAVGSPAATRLAFELVRPGGILAAVGVHTEARLAFSPGEAYDKNLTYRAGRAPARAALERMLDIARSGRFDLGAVLTHRLPLAEGPRAYGIFDERREGCIKVLLVPG
jgi:threonine dehydrogenase-like Zn-dependent dehydrogenase